jgi:hypothetical protein
MRMIQFEVIDEQGNRERDIYINPEHVRAVTSMQAYGKNQRTRISFGFDDNVLVRGTADEVQLKLQGREVPPAAEAPTLRVVEPK